MIALIMIYDILLQSPRDNSGITGYAQDWIKSFLSSRTQQVYYKGHKADHNHNGVKIFSPYVCTRSFSGLVCLNSLFFLAHYDYYRVCDA